MRIPAFEPEEDVKLHPEVFRQACAVLHCDPQVDLFASSRHKQLPYYLTIDATDVYALGINAFNYEWDSNVILYANPPWTLIDMVLDKIQQEGAHVLLVTPHWPHMPWWKELERMTERFTVVEDPLYLDTEGRLRPRPRWNTRFSLVKGPDSITL